MLMASNMLASSRPSRIQRKYKCAGRFAQDLILAAHFDIINSRVNSSPRTRGGRALMEKLAHISLRPLRRSNP